MQENPWYPCCGHNMRVMYFERKQIMKEGTIYTQRTCPRCRITWKVALYKSSRSKDYYFAEWSEL